MVYVTATIVSLQYFIDFSGIEAGSCSRKEENSKLQIGQS